MTEHEPTSDPNSKQPDDSHPVEEVPGPPTVAKPLWQLPFSILLGSILVTGALIYNGHELAQNLSLIAASSEQTTAAPVQAVAQQPAAPTQPTAPVTLTNRANQPTLGNSNAKVTVVEFGDFQCPFCKEFYQQTFGQIKSTYIDTGKIKYIFRDFPLTQLHVNAQIAAEAAECANQQGEFWQYHDILYTDGQSDGTDLDKASLEKYADQLGLNKGILGFGKNKFDQCLDTNATLPTVNADQALGQNIGVTGTPSFVILKNGDNTVDVNAVRTGQQSGQGVITMANGNVFIVGAQPFSTFQQAIDAALK